MYNLHDDPYEQTSIAAAADPDRVARLASWLDALRSCAGETCREAENAPLRRDARVAADSDRQRPKFENSRISFDNSPLPDGATTLRFGSGAGV
jgi:hypothetical protein